MISTIKPSFKFAMITRAKHCLWECVCGKGGGVKKKGGGKLSKIMKIQIRGRGREVNSTTFSFTIIFLPFTSIFTTSTKVRWGGDSMLIPFLYKNLRKIVCCEKKWVPFPFSYMHVPGLNDTWYRNDELTK